VSQSESTSVDGTVQLSVVSQRLSITGHVSRLRPAHLPTAYHWYGILSSVIFLHRFALT